MSKCARVLLFTMLIHSLVVFKGVPCRAAEDDSASAEGACRTVQMIRYDLRTGEKEIIDIDLPQGILPESAHSIGSAGADHHENANFGYIPNNLSDPTKILDTWEWPWRAICKVRGSLYGSGVLIDPKHVLTAAHVIIHPDYCLPNEIIWVEPGYDYTPYVQGRGDSPYGSAGVDRVYIWLEYCNSEDRNWDMAILELDRPIGALTGYMPYAYGNNCYYFKNNEFECAGYPGEGRYDGNEMYVREGTFWDCISTSGSGVAEGILVDRNNDENLRGMSGSGVFRKESYFGTRYVYAVCTHRFEESFWWDGYYGFNRIMEDEYYTIEGVIEENTTGGQWGVIDLIALDCAVEYATFLPGEQIQDMSYVILNYSNESYDGDVIVQYYISDDEEIVPGVDELIGAESFSVHLGAKEGMRRTVPPLNLPFLPDNIDEGRWYIGVHIVIDDYDLGNNWTGPKDVAKIEIGEFPGDVMLYNFMVHTDVCDQNRMTWTNQPPPDHTGFKIYRTNNGHRELIHLGTDPYENSFIDYDPPSGLSEYEIAAYLGSYEKTRSSWRASGILFETPQKPSVIFASEIYCHEVKLEWSGSELADYYRIYRDGEHIANVDHSPDVDFQIYYDFPPQGTYTYCVEAVNDCGTSVEMACDTGTLLEHGMLPPPQYLRWPIDAASNVVTWGEFDWSDVNGAADYYIQVKRSGGSTCTYPAILSGMSYSLQPGETYYWRVVCVDECGVIGSFSEWHSFSTIPPSPSNGMVRTHQKISASEGGFGGPLEELSYFGESIAYLGDLDCDGVGDVVVGAQGTDDGGLNRGAIWLLFLEHGGTVKSSLKISDTESDFNGVLHNNDWFGSSVASVGDLDGDGLGEIAVGATGDEGGSNRGAVWILFPKFGPSFDVSQKINDTEGNFDGVLEDMDFFGASLAPLGDLNGDGVRDLAVGARQDGDGGFARGAVWILFLNPDGTVDHAQKISNTEGNFNGLMDDADLFGYSLASLGDLDGDGVCDIAVGAPGDDDGGTDRGAVWILFLNSDGTVSHPQKISDTEGNLDITFVDEYTFGYSLSSLGDLDGDGVADLAVGAPRDEDGGLYRGAVWILFLNSDGTVKYAQKISNTKGNFTGILENEDLLGTAIASIGDLDGDGITDLAIGAFGDDDGGDRFGAVWVMFLGNENTLAMNTPVGQEVRLDTEQGLTLTFENVTQQGTTVFSFEDTGPDCPAGFQLAVEPPTYYYITTDAVTSGEIAICIDYDPMRIAANEEHLMLFHYDESSNPPDWVPISTGGIEGTICGVTSSLSPFVLAFPDEVDVLFSNVIASVSGNAVKLEWRVLDEATVEGFQIYRWEDGSSHEHAIVDQGLISADVRHCVDNDVKPGLTYMYEIGAVMENGSEIRSMAIRVNIMLQVLNLSQNHPNPFNPSTIIRYDIAKAGDVAINIYDLDGSLVKILYRGYRKPGSYEVGWDGKNNKGVQVASGIYFYRLTAGKETISKKMILLR